jgi:hypothetical protein
MSHGHGENHKGCPLCVHKGLDRIRKPAKSASGLQNASVVFETRSGKQSEKLILENTFCGFETWYPQ